MIADLRYRARQLSLLAAWSTLKTCTSPPEIETVFERASSGKNVGYVKKIRGLSLIEPGKGYVLTPSGFPVEDSLSFNNPQAPDPFQVGWPSIKAFAQSHSRPRAHIYDSVISIRHHHETNYYHFLVDVLGALELLDASGLGDSTPIVIGGQVARTGFGRAILKSGELVSRDWVLQDDECIWAEEIVYLRTYQQHRARIDHLLDLMDVPVPSNHDGDRLYLTRPPGCRRSVSNRADVATLLRNYGFREVITDDLPLEEQIELFQGARYVVGVHGAGLTNIIYRRGGPLGLLELHSYWFVLDCYDRLAREYGYFHDRLPCVGEPSPNWGGSDLLVDLPQLEFKLRRLLAEG
jgi:hypothetical protein